MMTHVFLIPYSKKRGLGASVFMCLKLSYITQCNFVSLRADAVVNWSSSSVTAYLSAVAVMRTLLCVKKRSGATFSISD